MSSHSSKLVWVPRQDSVLQWTVSSITSLFNTALESTTPGFSWHTTGSSKKPFLSKILEKFPKMNSETKLNQVDLVDPLLLYFYHRAAHLYICLFIVCLFFVINLFVYICFLYLFATFVTLYLSVFTYLLVYTCSFIFLFVYIFGCLYICLFIYFLLIFVTLYLSVYIYIFVYIFVCFCISYFTFVYLNSKLDSCLGEVNLTILQNFRGSVTTSLRIYSQRHIL